MKLSRDNPAFYHYDIFVSTLTKMYAGLRTSLKEVKLSNVVEADDESGFIVQHLTDEQGNLVYTNGHDDIAIDNTVKFLMCNPQLRQAFLASGFRPKLTSRYEKSLRIVRRVGVVEKLPEAREQLDLPNDRVQFDAI